ncbi:hypothetical protein ABFB10_04140 [Ponticoccus litoralis]|uniref:Uncharacterized protein n=1 Tax=Ponticoccus litoralis TaxID=422297 RepID=A0AAW9SNA3_9RHOB
MTDCKDSVEITMRATVLDVTPEESEEAPASTTQCARCGPRRPGGRAGRRGPRSRCGRARTGG